MKLRFHMNLYSKSIGLEASGQDVKNEIGYIHM